MFCFVRFFSPKLISLTVNQQETVLKSVWFKKDRKAFAVCLSCQSKPYPFHHLCYSAKRKLLQEAVKHFRLRLHIFHNGTGVVKWKMDAHCFGRMLLYLLFPFLLPLCVLVPL